jgi:hypothetical protein
MMPRKSESYLEMRCIATDSMAHDGLLDFLTLATHRTNIDACLMSLPISTTLDSSDHGMCSASGNTALFVTLGSRTLRYK